MDRRFPKYVFSILILSVGVLIVSCGSGVKVFTDYDPSYDIPQYKSFSWSPVKNIEQGQNPIYYNELNDKRIRHAVQDQMISRGYELTEDDGELVLHYHIVIQDQTVVTTDPFGHSNTPYWLSLQQNYYQYTQGTLIVDIMKGGTNDLVWRGRAVSIIDDTYKPGEADELVQDAVARLLKDFPRAANQKTDAIQD
jgi:hypothetical protein